MDFIKLVDFAKQYSKAKILPFFNSINNDIWSCDNLSLKNWFPGSNEKCDTSCNLYHIGMEG